MSHEPDPDPLRVEWHSVFAIWNWHWTGCLVLALIIILIGFPIFTVIIAWFYFLILDQAGQ